jgi:cobalt transporter subunit CbtB
MAATLPASAATRYEALGRRASAVVQAVAAMLLGALVIGVAGFSHLDVMHNAAHDTRHANGFPCH